MLICKKIIFLFVLIIFIQGCGLSPQELQALSNSLNQMNNALYGNNNAYSNKSTFTKVCDYTCLGSAYSITIGSTELCPISPPCDPRAGSISQSYTTSGSTTCYGDYNYTSGHNKVCRYKCLGQPHAITIGATAICPLTIKR